MTSKVEYQRQAAGRLADVIVASVQRPAGHVLTADELAVLAGQVESLGEPGRRVAERLALMDRARSDETWSMVPGIIRDRASRPDVDAILRNVRALSGPEVSL